MKIETIMLSKVDRNKLSRSLNVCSEYFGGSFPSQFIIKSDWTGKEILFKVLPPEHPKFDQDQYDGEFLCYFPHETIDGYDIASVFHAY